MNREDPTTFNSPDVEYLRPGNLDNVARALVTLLREVTVLNDRVMVLEEVLAAEGIAVREKVDTYQPDEEFQARIDAAMQRIIAPVIASLTGADGLDQ